MIKDDLGMIRPNCKSFLIVYLTNAYKIGYFKIKDKGGMANGRT